MNGKVVAVLMGIAVLSACNSNKPSPERHAYYFVSHQSNFTGGNYTSSISQNYRLNVPQFRELYKQGKADRAAGQPPSYAQQYAQAIRDRLKEEAKTEHAFTGNSDSKWTSEMEPKDAILYGNELATTYLDGYHGVQ